MALILSNINIINYKSILDTSIDVKKIDGSYTTILVGLNEMGKSNFLNAIELIDYPVKDVNFNSLKNTSNEKGKYIEAYFEYTFSSENEWRDIFLQPILWDKWAENKQVYAPDKDFADALLHTSDFQLTRFQLSHLYLSCF